VVPTGRTGGKRGDERPVPSRLALTGVKIEIRFLYRAVIESVIQVDLFEADDRRTPGLGYQTDAITREQEQDLAAVMNSLPFKEFGFQGFPGKRRVVSFGWRFDFNGGGMTQAEPIPEFLFPRAQLLDLQACRLIICSTCCSPSIDLARRSAGTTTGRTSMT
jgi:hypothetical protein